MLSYSKVSLFKQCPYRYKLRYLDNLETYPNLDPSNPLYLGTALHDAIETGDTERAIKGYFEKYPIITDEHEEEAIKLEAMAERMRAFVPEGGVFEYKLINKDYIGFIDYLIENGDGTYDVYDFKYASRPESYENSEQIHVYAYYLSKEGKEVRNLYYLVAPKVSIRMKKEERREDFRKRLKEELRGKNPILIDIEYDERKVKGFLEDCRRLEETTEFPKIHSGLCPWCEYHRYCKTDGKEDIDIMMLPKNVKVAKGDRGHVRIWLYGMPFSGKTYLANQFPDVLMLNTDGNTKYIDAPRIRIKDEVQEEGRRTVRTLAWDVLKEAIGELEKGSEFKTIVLDLVEDTYEMCRKWGYQKLGIEHESEDSFKAWDYIRTEFLSTMRRFLNLDYDIILISHEDVSRDIMKRSGDKVTAIKPNIGDKIALKLAGMVDVVARVIKTEDSRIISFKTNDVVFGGGRIPINGVEIPCTYKALVDVIDNHLPEPKQEEEKPRKARKMPDGGGDIVQASVEATEEEDDVEIKVEEQPLAVEEKKEEAPRRTRVRKARS